MYLKVTHICKYWTASHLHSKKGSFAQRVISVLNFFPMDSVIILTRIAQSIIALDYSPVASTCCCLHICRWRKAFIFKYN